VITTFLLLAATPHMCSAPEIELVPADMKLVVYDITHAWLAAEGCRTMFDGSVCLGKLTITEQPDGTRKLEVICKGAEEGA